MRWLTGVIIILGLIISISPDLRVIEKELVVYHDKPVYKSVYEYQPNFKYDVPDERYVRNLDILANNIFVPLEQHFQQFEPKFKLHLTSMSRDWKFGSEHVQGKAADIDIDDIYECVSNLDIYNFIKDSLYFNQLIIYNSMEKPTHIHVSFDECENRNELWFCKKKWRRKPKYTRLSPD